MQLIEQEIKFKELIKKFGEKFGNKLGYFNNFSDSPYFNKTKNRFEFMINIDKKEIENIIFNEIKFSITNSGKIIMIKNFSFTASDIEPKTLEIIRKNINENKLLFEKIHKFLKENLKNKAKINNKLTNK